MKRFRIAHVSLVVTFLMFGGCTRREGVSNTDRMTPDVYAAESMLSAIAVRYYRDGMLPSTMADVSEIADDFSGPYGRHAGLIDPATNFKFGDELDSCVVDFQWMEGDQVQGDATVTLVRRGRDWGTVLVPVHLETGDTLVPFDDVINVSCAVAGDIYDKHKGQGDAVVDLSKMPEIGRRYSEHESYARIDPIVIVRKDRIIMHVTSEVGRETLIFSELGPGRDRLKRQRDDP